MAAASLALIGKIIAGASTVGGLVQQNVAANKAEQNMRRQRKDAIREAKGTAKEGVDTVDIALGDEDETFAASMLRTATPSIGGLAAGKVGGLR